MMREEGCIVYTWESSETKIICKLTEKYYSNYIFHIIILQVCFREFLDDERYIFSKKSLTTYLQEKIVTFLVIEKQRRRVASNDLPQSFLPLGIVTCIVVRLLDSYTSLILVVQHTKVCLKVFFESNQTIIELRTMLPGIIHILTCRRLSKKFRLAIYILIKGISE